ncbi:Farnesyltransferase subunit beta, partial [Meredithblackwellia eburnea MCA 4105]
LPWIQTPSDGLETETLESQHETEQSISQLLSTHMSSFSPPTLNKNAHLTWLTGMIKDPLPHYFVGLDASRPWLLYWVLHSLALFEGELDVGGKKRVVRTLAKCQNKQGGFGGGPGQLSHLAPSQGMYNFLMSLKQPDGSFIMHDGGEVDVRGCYCCLTIATVLNILTPELAANTSSFIASCQTFEGGLASASHPFTHQSSPPLGEAHGGYAFCAAASYVLLQPFDSLDSPLYRKDIKEKSSSTSSLDLESLARWATGMQANPIEGGGFRGRTNKLVDGCYSWWGGGLFGILEALLSENLADDQEVVELFDRSALQEYVLLVAQGPVGGLRDKPGKNPDAYHTCYNLSGLSSAQHRMVRSPRLVAELKESFASPFEGDAARVVEEGEEVEMILGEGESQDDAERRMKEVWSRSLGWEERDTLVIGDKDDNELMPTHAVFNLVQRNARAAMEYFYIQPPARTAE